MYLPNLKTLFTQTLSIISIFSDFKSEPSKITCPSSQQINDRIAAKESMEFSGLQYRDNSNGLSKTILEIQ